MTKKIIIRLNDSNKPQTSPEGVNIQKIVSSIGVSDFVKLLKVADNKVNPRIATVNKITKSIHDTLDGSPELLWLKSKGLLIATENCIVLDRNRVNLTFDNLDFEGIMDGGHNTFAIAIYIIEKLFDERKKWDWDLVKQFWEENYEEILLRFKGNEGEFRFSIPVEIISPNGEDGSIEEYYDHISEICSARNNNVQLKETAKGNQVGCYDYLKDQLTEYDIIWKTGDHGKIKSEDVISLATIPLLFLQERDRLPENIKDLNKISVYSQKSRCIDFFNSIIKHEDVSDEENGKYILKDSYVQSALKMIDSILRFFDQMYIEFPRLYHEASPGKFGRISSVKMKESKVPFHTTEQQAQYQYPFGFFYPIVAGLTSLMKINEDEEIVEWLIDPEDIDFDDLDLTQYVNIIKIVFFDPQKIGKGEVFYKEAENVFEKVII